jgi:integrase
MPHRGRPPLPIGAYGEISTYPVRGARKPTYAAKARFRDRDGVVRPVVRTGQTKAAAERALKKALAERQEHAGGTLNRNARVADLARHWLESEIDASTKAVTTKQEYRGNVARYVTPRMGALRLREVDTGLVADVLTAITAEHGPSAAKSAKSVLNGMFGLAVRYGALTVNPVRESGRLSVRRKVPRALTRTQETELADKLRAHERAVAWDLPDFVDWMLATGCRIGEALAVRDGLTADQELRLDLEAGIWEVDATSIRVKGNGVVIQEKPKSEAGWRRITVPRYAMEMLRRRQGELRLQPTARLMTPDGVIREADGVWVAFPSPGSRTLRDGSNTQADLREVFDGLDCAACSGTGYVLEPDGSFVLKQTPKGAARVRCKEGPWSWITSHTFRKTVTTRLLAAGLPPQEVADHVGHSEPSMTLNRYAGRGVVSADAARILDR